MQDSVLLQINHQKTSEGGVLITLTGRLMLGPEGAELEKLVRDQLSAGTRKFVLDFSGLTHIDSTGIGRCIASLNMIMQANGSLIITGASGQVRESFRVTQLDRVFEFS